MGQRTQKQMMLDKNREELVKNISKEEVKIAHLIIGEIPKSTKDIQELVENYNMDYKRFSFILNKKELAEAYSNALEIRTKLNSNTILNKALKSWEELIEGKAVEEKEIWDVDPQGVKTLKNVMTTRKSPNQASIEKALKILAPEKFSDKMKPDQVIALFMGFNNYLVNSCNRVDLAQELMAYEKEYALSFDR